MRSEYSAVNIAALRGELGAHKANILLSASLRSSGHSHLLQPQPFATLASVFMTAFPAPFPLSDSRTYRSSR